MKKLKNMKQIFCKKNQLTKIISNFGTGYPKTFNVTIIPEGNEDVSGIYLEKRYLWIFTETPNEGKIKDKGVCIPSTKEMYDPILEEMETFGFTFKKESIEL